MKSFPTERAAVFLVFVLASGILFYFFASGVNRAVDPVSLLPGDTAVLIDIKKPVDDINRLRNSKFGIQVTSIEWQQVLHEVGMPDEHSRDVMSLFGEIGAITRSFIFNELFADRALLGLIPLSQGRSGWLRQRSEVEQMVVLIARPRHPASLVDTLMSFSSDRQEGPTQAYRGGLIRKFKFDNRHSFFTTVTDGLFIASLSQELVQLCIDNSIRNKTSGRSGLNDNDGYLNLKQRAGGRDDQFIYLNMNKLEPVLHAYLHPGEYPPHSGYSPELFSSGSFILKRVGLFRVPGKRTMNYTGIIQFNRDTVHLDNRLFQLYEPKRDSVVALVPDNNVVHLWLNIFHARKLWNLMRSNRNSTARALVQSIEHLIKDRTGKTVNDLLPLFDNQVSMNISEMKSSGIIPMPRISLYFQVNDPLKMQELLMQLLEGLEIRQSRVGGVDLYSIILADGLMQPSFMFYDRFLVMADSRKQLESMLSRDKKSLLDSPLFRRVDIGLTEANNFVLYFRNAELIDGMKELVRWYGSLLQLFDNTSPVRNRIIVEKIILPLLEGMKMYKVKTIRIYTEKNEMILQSSQLLKKY